MKYNIIYYLLTSSVIKMGIGASSYINSVINGFSGNYAQIMMKGNKIKDIVSFVEIMDHFYSSDYILHRDDSILYCAKCYFSEEIIKSLKSHNKIDFNDVNDYEDFMNMLDILIKWDTIKFYDFYGKMCLIGLQLGDNYAEYANCSITRNIMEGNTDIFERKKAIVDEFYMLSPTDQIKVFNNIVYGIKYHILVYYDKTLYESSSDNESESEDSDKIEIVGDAKITDNNFIPDPRYAIIINMLFKYEYENKDKYFTDILINKLFDKGIKSLKRAKMDTNSFEILLKSITLYICKIGHYIKKILINRILNKMDYDLLITFIENTPSARNWLRMNINDSNDQLKKYIKMLINLFVDNTTIDEKYPIIRDIYFKNYNKYSNITKSNSNTLDLCLKASEVENIIISLN